MLCRHGGNSAPAFLCWPEPDAGDVEAEATGGVMDARGQVSRLRRRSDAREAIRGLGWRGHRSLHSSTRVREENGGGRLEAGSDGVRL